MNIFIFDASILATYRVEYFQFCIFDSSANQIKLGIIFVIAKMSVLTLSQMVNKILMCIEQKKRL